MQTLVEIGLFSAPTGLLRRKNGTKKKYGTGEDSNP